MPAPLILASASEIRARLLANAGLQVALHPARIDEDAIKAAILAEGGHPRDLADALAEMKALKISDRFPQALVIGADQVLEVRGQIFSKPASPQEAAEHLAALSGQTHRLLSAVVVCHEGRPLWRHVGEVRLTMHPLTSAEIDAYVARTWDSIRHAVGCYKLEEDGIRLFSAIEGDYFTILGLPMLPLLNWLRVRGEMTP